MALRNIVTVGDPVLTKVCRPVTKFDSRLSQLIDDMIETLTARDWPLRRSEFCAVWS